MGPPVTTSAFGCFGSLPCVFFAGFLVIAGGLVYYNYQKQQERERQLTKLATRRGFRYFPKHLADDRETSFFGNLFNPQGPIGPYDQIASFEIGSNHKAFNTLHGSIDAAGRVRQTFAGDWSYTTGSGKNQSTHRRSYVMLHCPEAHRGSVTIRPEGFFDGIAASVGFNDLDFESVAFSDAFHVKADDERFAYDLFHPPMIDLFLTGRPPHVWVGRAWLCVFGSGLWTPREIEQYLAFAVEAIERWPRHLQEGTA